jgi:hypothetical protein
MTNTSNKLRANLALLGEVHIWGSSATVLRSIALDLSGASIFKVKAP